jgi:DNA-binding response OmpR family regulator
MQEPASDWNAPLSARGSALVALDDDRAALASTLVLQEIGLTVDVARSLESAIEWIEAAHYEIVIAAGRAGEDSADFAIRARYLSRDTRVILLAEAGFDAAEMADLGVEVLAAPVDVNGLMAAIGEPRA